MRILMQARTTQARHAVVAAAVDAIWAAGGYVIDSTQFSNKAVCLSLELSPAGYPSVCAALAAKGVDVAALTADELQYLAACDPDRMLPGSLSIDFVHGEPDLRIKVPAVPG